MGTYKLHSPNQLVIAGDAFERWTTETVDATFGEPATEYVPRFPLVICDPPYGEITREKWDVADYSRWMKHCVQVAATDATIAMWGGIGKPKDRPFLEFTSRVESEFPFTIKNMITWGKKRAYGVADNYLFTREECLILTRGKPTFNIPLLTEADGHGKRGYDGYNKKYPAKSEYKRRTNVWTDVTELLRGKIHPTQKPDRLYEILIETHSLPGDIIYDPCAGSGTTARAATKLGRGYCIIERDAEYLKQAGLL